LVIKLYQKQWPVKYDDITVSVYYE